MTTNPTGSDLLNAALGRKITPRLRPWSDADLLRRAAGLPDSPDLDRTTIPEGTP